MNPEQEIALLNNLLNQILAGIQETLQSGEILTDEFQGQLADEIERTVQRIDQLNAEIGQNPVEGLQPGGIPPATPNLQPGAYPSSNINSYKYDPDNQRLWVKFHGRDTAESGPTYRYEGVPRNIYDVFARGGVAPRTSGENQYHRWIRGVTPSLGASMYALIRNGGYQYNRIG